MMFDNFNLTIARRLLEGINSKHTDFVSLPKPVVRAMVCEYIRFKEGESIGEAQRTEFIQRMAVEYAVMHMADLMVSLKRETPPAATLDDVLAFAIEQLQALARAVAIKTEGNG